MSNDLRADLLALYDEYYADPVDRTEDMVRWVRRLIDVHAPDPDRDDRRVEAVARVLFEHRFRDQGGIPCAWTELPKSHRKSYREQADAVLAAYR